MSLAKNPKEFFLTYDAAVPFPVSKLFLLLYVKLKTLTGLFIVSEFSVKNFLIGINKLRVKTFLFFVVAWRRLWPKYFRPFTRDPIYNLRLNFCCCPVFPNCEKYVEVKPWN